LETYTLSLVVLAFSPFSIDNLQQENDGLKNKTVSWQLKQKPKKKDSRQFFAFIQSIDQDGLMEIRFSRSILITPNISEYNNETIKIKVESAILD
jgi:hypothetical protein